jgi:N-acetylmuramidase/Putative peptidoglycan binding domain
LGDRAKPAGEHKARKLTHDFNELKIKRPSAQNYFAGKNGIFVPTQPEGPKMAWKGNAMFTTDITHEITGAARTAGIDPAALLAVVEVESAGKFFARVKGREEPLIRFEFHYFDRRLDDGMRDRARASGVSSPLAGKVPNPRGQEDRWALLERACAFSRPAALESVSWGIGQIMGAHWKALGFGSVEELVELARSGAAGQIRLLILFFEKNSLIPLLNARDWAAFARRYNGPAYRRYAYDTKLAIAYARHKAAAPELPAQSVKDLQLALSAAGYAAAPTGIFDRATSAALIAFQKAHGLEADGIAGPKTWGALRKEAETPKAEPNWLLVFLNFVASLFGWRKS